MSVKAADEALAAPVSEGQSITAPAVKAHVSDPRLVALPEELLSNISARLGSDEEGWVWGSESVDVCWKRCQVRVGDGG